jgi:YD repeat-containing protein
VIIEGHDFNTASPVSQSISEDSQSLLTGLTIEKVSAAGVITVYEYDALGRIIKTMIAKGSPYSATRLCAYHIDDEFIKRYRPEGSALSVLIEETDASGRRRRSTMLKALSVKHHAPSTTLWAESARKPLWNGTVQGIHYLN